MSNKIKSPNGTDRETADFREPPKIIKDEVEELQEYLNFDTQPLHQDSLTDSAKQFRLYQAQLMEGGPGNIQREESPESLQFTTD